MPSIVSQRTLSVHQEHELLLKLEMAGLDHDLAQIVIDSKDNEQAKAIVESLRNGNFVVSQQKSQPAAPRELPTFLAGRIGIYKTLEAVQVAFTEKGAQNSTFAERMMSNPAFVLSQAEQDMEWVAASGYQLGFTKAYTRVALIDRAEKQFGLDRCQPEDGVYIRLGYLKQPKGESRLLAMDPIALPLNLLLVFSFVHYDEGLCLNGHSDSAVGQCDLGYVWLFRRRKVA